MHTDMSVDIPGEVIPQDLVWLVYVKLRIRVPIRCEHADDHVAAKHERGDPVFVYSRVYSDTIDMLIDMPIDMRKDIR